MMNVEQLKSAVKNDKQPKPEFISVFLNLFALKTIDSSLSNRFHELAKRARFALFPRFSKIGWSWFALRRWLKVRSLVVSSSVLRLRSSGPLIIIMIAPKGARKMIETTDILIMSRAISTFAGSFSNFAFSNAIGAKAAYVKKWKTI